MESFPNTSVRQSMSVKPNLLPSPDSQKQFTFQFAGSTAAIQGTRHEGKIKNKDG